MRIVLARQYYLYIAPYLGCYNNHYVSCQIYIGKYAQTIYRKVCTHMCLILHNTNLCLVQCFLHFFVRWFCSVFTVLFCSMFLFDVFLIRKLDLYSSLRHLNFSRDDPRIRCGVKTNWIPLKTISR